MICPKCARSLPDDALICCYCGRKIVSKQKKALRRANGTGTVYKQSGKRSKPWRARMNCRTKVYEVGTFATKAEAERALALFTPPTASIIKEGMTLGDLYALVVQTKEGKIADASLETYRTAWNHLKPLADVPFCEIKAADFQRIIDGMKGYSHSAQNKVKVLVSLICGTAVANGMAVTNAARFLVLPPPPKKDRRKKTVFSREDINKLWMDASPDAEIVLVLIYTGMRIGELFALMGEDVHLNEEGYNFLIGGEKTDAGRDRVIVLNDRIVPIVTRWIEKNGNGLLLKGARGSRLDPRNWRERHYYPLLDRLGIERLNPHKTRHTFATLAAGAGAVPTSLQKFLGHADFSTTADYYTHPDLEDLNEIAQKLS